ncbi:MAG: PIN domain-containing protein, partial [Acidobacteria bacterium ACB2]|nr:PIN domain-containing protein [Acidobacteria bacterium ACB2]
MRFWDASAIVPLLVSQASTERVRRLYREDPAVVVWWATATMSIELPSCRSEAAIGAPDSGCSRI